MGTPLEEHVESGLKMRVSAFQVELMGRQLDIVSLWFSVEVSDLAGGINLGADSVLMVFRAEREWKAQGSGCI